jgi:ADP-heptose:LPS heptosyltransferase
MPELEKNRLLGSAILGNDLSAVFPSLVPGEESLATAREILRLHGLTEGAYWIACVGSRSGLTMKDWGEDNWRNFFSSVLPSVGRPVVFFGNQKEWASIERIRSAGFVSVNLADAPPPVPVSLALAAMSCGYLGRDSGVMHLASATGRPVLAAFSGGHWGRFLPSSGPAVVVTQAMSCRMCDFACPHAQPHCITAIRPATMLAGWNRLSAAENVEVIEQPPPEEADAVSPDEARSFAMRRSAEIRERESLARSGPWWRRRGPDSGSGA